MSKLKNVPMIGKKSAVVPPSADQSANPSCTQTPTHIQYTQMDAHPCSHAHRHTHIDGLQSVCWTKSKVKHEYRGWQANYQMYSSFCIPTSEGKQMWESCRFHSSRHNDMAEQQKAQPSQGIEMDRVVNLLPAIRCCLVGFHISSLGRCAVARGCLS